MALPRLYTQVLHLMNKMHLPLPFEPGSIPGAFAEEWMVAVTHRQSESFARPTEEQVVEEEELLPPSPPQHASSVTAPLLKTLPPSPRRNAKRARTASVPSVARAFQDAEEAPRSAASDRKPPRPGVVSMAELARQRLPPTEWRHEPAFQGYSRGSPSTQLHVQNLANSVDAKDLEALFGHVLPVEYPLAYVNCIRF
jgi:U11/U12 small nuclear ribonucleoprotein SNRNP65